MKYLKYSPSGILSSLVECYFVWQGNVPVGETLELESPPNGFSSIVFVLGDPYVLRNVKYPRLDVPAQYVAGQSIYSYSLQLAGKVDMAGIVFKPAALSTFFDLAMYKYVEERIDLYEVFSRSIIDKVKDQLHSEELPEDKARVLDNFVLKMYEEFKPRPDYVDEVANKIVSENGMVMISELVKQCNTTRRTLERNFLYKVGLSPKFYAMVRRISHICNLIAGKQQVDWSRILYYNEFCDQAHFIKNFESFTGRSPTRYLKENKELAKLVTKPDMMKIKYG